MTYVNIAPRSIWTGPPALPVTFAAAQSRLARGRFSTASEPSERQPLFSSGRSGVMPAPNDMNSADEHIRSVVRTDGPHVVTRLWSPKPRQPGNLPEEY